MVLYGPHFYLSVWIAQVRVPEGDYIASKLGYIGRFEVLRLGWS